MKIMGFVAVWAMIIALYYGLSQNETGRKILSYAIYLLIVLLIVTHAQEISDFYSEYNPLQYQT